MITNLGRNHIRAFMVGVEASIGQGLAVGTNPVAPTVDDTDMGFEVARVQVSSVSIDPVTNKIVFKGTLNTDTQISVYEVGLWSSATRESDLLLTFSEFEEEWTGDFTVVEDAPLSRIGSSFINVDIADATAKTLTYQIEATDFSNYLGPDDRWTIALNKIGAASLTVRLRLVSSQGSLEMDFFPSNTNATGYMFASANLHTAVTTGTFDSTSVESFELTTAPVAGNVTASSVQFDGVEVSNAVSERNSSVLVARTLTNPPFITESGGDFDVEYEMEIVV